MQILNVEMNDFSVLFLWVFRYENCMVLKLQKYGLWNTFVKGCGMNEKNHQEKAQRRKNFVFFRDSRRLWKNREVYGSVWKNMEE